MSYRRKRILTLIVLSALSLIIVLSRSGRSDSSAVTVSFLGYTNPPSSSRLFAILHFSNETGHAIRWRGEWVEIEGRSNHLARIINSALPGSKINPVVLKQGDSMVLTVGLPFEEHETGKWRLTLLYTQNSIKWRIFDFARKRDLPLQLGSLKLIDVQELFNVTNSITLSSEWLTKQKPDSHNSIEPP